MTEETLQEKVKKLEQENQLLKDNLKSSEKKNKRLISYLEESNDGMCLLDLEKTILEINKKGAEILGYTKEELINNQIELFNFYGKSEGLDRLFQFLNRQKEIYQYEGYLKAKSGKIVEILFNGKVVPYKDKEVVIGSFHDVTEYNELKRELLKYNNELSQIVKEQTEEIKLTQEISLKTLSMIAEIKDKDTSNHLKRIKYFVEAIGEEAMTNSKYSEYLINKTNYIESIGLASILHDIGKVAIPDEILLKPGQLTEVEYNIMKTHSTIAADLLQYANEELKTRFNKDSYFALAYEIARHHHEKCDGKGYPDHLTKDQIPLSARITAIADIYDALRSKRPYKDPFSHKRAVSIITELGKTELDSDLVKCFNSIEKKIEKIYNYLTE